MLEIFRTSSFKSDYKKLNIDEKDKLKEVVPILAAMEILDAKYKDHQLMGNLQDCRECHVKPDLLLMYKIDKENNELQLVRISSHSQLFKK